MSEAMQREILDFIKLFLAVLLAGYVTEWRIKRMIKHYRLEKLKNDIINFLKDIKTVLGLEV